MPNDMMGMSDARALRNMRRKPALEVAIGVGKPKNEEASEPQSKDPDEIVQEISSLFDELRDSLPDASNDIDELQSKTEALSSGQASSEAGLGQEPPR